MKKLEPFETDIEETLSKGVDRIDVSPAMFSKIKAEIIRREERGSIMKNLITKKKMGKRAAIILGLCMATAVVAAPLVQQYSYVSSSGAKRYKEFGDLKKIEKEIGFAPKYVEALPNDFYFSEGTLVKNYIGDESGKTVNGSQTKGMAIYYTKENSTQDQIMALDINPITEVDREIQEQSQVTSDPVEMHGGAKLQYESMPYKFVPVDYELTDEEIKAQEAGELMISYGSKEVETSFSQSVRWEENGLSYILLNMNYDLTEDQMLDMAKFIIDSQK